MAFTPKRRRRDRDVGSAPLPTAAGGFGDGAGEPIDDGHEVPDRFPSRADLVGSGFEHVHPSRARIGDLALTPSADASFTEGALGIVTGAVVTVVAPNGLGAVPLSSAIAAWRV